MIEAKRIRNLFAQEIVLPRMAYNLIGMAVFTVLTILGAFVKIPLPFTPVPITLQTFFVLLSGPVLGGEWGGISQLLYVLLGIGGLPVFAGANGGMSYLSGPTGGYIIGFILASYVVGRLAKREDISPFHLTIAMGVGTGIIYLTGSLYLAWTLRIGPIETFYLGVFPFLPGDILKAIGVVILYNKWFKRPKFKNS